MKKKIDLIGISGKIGAGKDTVGMIIQALTIGSMRGVGMSSRYAKDPLAYLQNYPGRPNLKGGMQIKKFAGLLKQFVSLATGIPIDSLEDQDVKSSYLGQEWSYLREERFSEKGVISRKPVRYYLTPRVVLQKLGTEVARNIHPNFWINGLFASRVAPYNQWIITDLRFPNEKEAIEERDGITIRVNRPGKESSGPQHISETALDNFSFTHVIENDGSLEDLIVKVRDILELYEIGPD